LNAVNRKKMAEIPLQLRLTEEAVVRLMAGRSVWTFEDLYKVVAKITVPSIAKGFNLRSFLLTRPQLFRCDAAGHFWSLAQKDEDYLQWLKKVADNDQEKEPILSDYKKLNPISSVISTCYQNTKNSKRVRHQSSERIFFKIGWIYSRLPSHIKAIWSSLDELISDLGNDYEFIVIGENVHLTQLVSSAPVITSSVLARLIIDILFQDAALVEITEIRKRLPLRCVETMNYSYRSAIDFANFYPEYFCANTLETHLGLQTSTKRSPALDSIEMKTRDDASSCPIFDIDELEAIKDIPDDFYNPPAFVCNKRQLSIDQGLGRSEESSSSTASSRGSSRCGMEEFYALAPLDPEDTESGNILTISDDEDD
jgi:hypothetical protein